MVTRRTGTGHSRDGLIALVLATLVVAAVAACSDGRGGDGRARLTTGSSSGDEATTTTARPSAAAPASASASADGLRITISTSRSVVPVGSRLRVRVAVTNVGSVAVPRDSGGCDALAQTDLRVVGTSGPPREPSPVGDRAEVGWDGAPASFADHVDRRGTYGGADATGGVPPVPGMGDICPSIARIGSLAPGATEERDKIVDVRPGALPLDDRGYEVAARFVSNDGKAADVRLPVDLTDDPQRLATLDEAIAALPTAPTLDGWVAASKAAVEPRLTQRFEPILTWWNGRWELWLLPAWDADTGSLRVLWSRADHAVTEVRAVPLLLPPTDDPDATPRGDGIRPDTIRSARAG